jgi:Cu-processing system ATP-binding protein
MTASRDTIPMIVASGVTKRFGTLQVLKGIDLVLGRGRVTAILGPNAAGKTTFIKVLLGLTRPDAGTVLLDGGPLGDDPSYRAEIGYMPQLPPFPENLSAAKLIALLSDLRGREATQDRELIESLRLGGELDKPLRTLSGGTRQKVNAVLAFLFAPRLLVLDEPTAGLDPISSRVLKEKILAERDRGKTFLLTSHVMSELDELVDDVVLLVDGVVRFCGSAQRLKVQTEQLNLERAVAQLMREEAA